MRLVVFVALALTTVATAGTVTNTFDSPAGPVYPDGLTALGVTYHVTGSLNVFYDDQICTACFSLDPLSDPVMDGDATAVLTLDFQNPSTLLAFDFALGGIQDGDSKAVTVVLSGQGFSGPAMSALTGSPDNFSLAVGQFSYSGSAFNQAVISFQSGSQMFALDNLTYNQISRLPPGVNAESFTTPEPGPAFLMLGGLLLLALRYFARRRAAC